jgi:hypothetical protein
MECEEFNWVLGWILVESCLGGSDCTTFSDKGFERFLFPMLVLVDDAARTSRRWEGSICHGVSRVRY